MPSQAAGLAAVFVAPPVPPPVESFSVSDLVVVEVVVVVVFFGARLFKTPATPDATSCVTPPTAPATAWVAPPTTSPTGFLGDVDFGVVVLDGFVDVVEPVWSSSF